MYKEHKHGFREGAHFVPSELSFSPIVNHVDDFSIPFTATRTENQNWYQNVIVVKQEVTHELFCWKKFRVYELTE